MSEKGREAWEPIEALIRLGGVKVLGIYHVGVGETVWDYDKDVKLTITATSRPDRMTRKFILVELP